MTSPYYYPKHETKLCPRCGSPFLCKANRVMHCDCMSVQLSDVVVDYIQDHYDDCLCVDCLRALQCELTGEGD